MTITPETPLRHVQDYMKANLPKGVSCPACGQSAKIYNRPLNQNMARGLIAMYQAGELNWVHMPTVLGGKSREEAKLAHWGLIEEQRKVRPDGGRAGWWRVTPRGELFLMGMTKVPKYIALYDRRLVATHGEMWSIADALGEPFNLSKMLATIF